MFNMKWVILFIFLFILIPPMFAEVPPQPDCPNISVSVAHTGDNSTVGLTGAVPFEKGKLDGYIALSGHHVHDGTAGTDVTTRLGYVEAGISVKQFELNGFVKALKNSERDLNRQIDYGYFIQFHGKNRKVRRWNISAGLGNFARSEIMEISQAEHTSFNWKAFVRLQNRRGLSIQFETTSDVSLNDFEYILSPSHSFTLSDKLNLDVDVNLLWADDAFYSSSLIGATFSF